MNMDRLAYGKQSIAVNLKKKESIEIIKKLASDAHVLIEPFRTGLFTTVVSVITALFDRLIIL